MFDPMDSGGGSRLDLHDAGGGHGLRLIELVGEFGRRVIGICVGGITVERLRIPLISP